MLSSVPVCFVHEVRDEFCSYSYNYQKKKKKLVIFLMSKWVESFWERENRLFTLTGIDVCSLYIIILPLKNYISMLYFVNREKYIPAKSRLCS